MDEATRRHCYRADNFNSASARLQASNGLSLVLEQVSLSQYGSQSLCASSKYTVYAVNFYKLS